MYEAAHPPLTASQREIVRALKRIDRGEGTAPPLEIRHESGEYLGALTPVTQREAGDAEICALLSRWRRMYKRNFLTQFEPTPERTQRWLTNVVLPDDTRILFLVRAMTTGLSVTSVSAASPPRAWNSTTSSGAKRVEMLGLSISRSSPCWRGASPNWACPPPACMCSAPTGGPSFCTSPWGSTSARSPLWWHESDGDSCLTTDSSPQAQPAGFDLVRMELTRAEFDAQHAWVYSVARGGVWTR